MIKLRVSIVDCRNDMMNTLPSQGILERLRGHAPLQELGKRLSFGQFPIDIAEAEGSFASIVVAFLSRELEKRQAGPILVVLPTDQEAEALASDLALAGIEADILPWWRTAAYRPASARARVFGERAAVLARFVLREVKIVVASARAFVTPLPPPADFSSPRFFRSRRAAASTRPPSVNASPPMVIYACRGSRFRANSPLRGEVLDIYMPGDEAAVRVIFDYDRVGKVSSFDPAGQAGLKILSRAIIRPMKEILWTADRVAAIASVAPGLPNCSGRTEALIEELSEKGEAKGEELWYPLAWKESASVLDYLGPQGLLVLLDHERLEAQEESTRKEFAGLYRGALKEGPVPPPDRLLKPFGVLEDGYSRKIRSFAPQR